MTELESQKTDEEAPTSTGRYYEVGRINVCTKIAKEVPWKSGTPVVIVYDKEKDELRIKPYVLVY